jgi:hypothetical protein
LAREIAYERRMEAAGKTPASRRPISRHSANNRSRVTNGRTLLPGVDGRSASARRYRDLIAELARELGDAEPTAAESASIRQAAAIIVRSEQLSADIVRGEPVDNDTLIRLSSEARRIMARLKRHVDVDTRSPPSLLRGRLEVEVAK